MMWGIYLLIIAMIIIIVINLILQGSVIPFLTFLVYLPNPALVSIVTLSLFKGKYYGAFFGLFMGLFQDMLFGSVVGVNALIYFLIGYASGMMNNSLNNENAILHVIFSAASTIAYNAMYFLLMFFMSNIISLDGAIKRIFSIEILYNCILAFIFYKIVYKKTDVSTLKFGKRKR